MKISAQISNPELRLEENLKHYTNFFLKLQNRCITKKNGFHMQISVRQLHMQNFYKFWA